MIWLSDWLDRVLFGALLVFMLVATVGSCLLLSMVISRILEGSI